VEVFLDGPQEFVGGQDFLPILQKLIAFEGLLILPSHD